MTSSAAARDWPDVRQPLREATALLLGLKLLLGVLAVYVVASAAVPGPCHFELARDGWTTTPALAAGGNDFLLVGVWQRWDGCWLGKIATYGYEPGTDSAVFFPLMPALIAVVAPLVGGRVALAGELVAAVAYLVAIALILELVAGDFGRGIARRTVLYLSIFPAAFFLLAPFTESVFLAATAGALLAARRRRWGLALVAALLASLARTQGLLVVLPLAWEAFRTLRERGVLDRAGPAVGARVVAAIPPLLAVAAPAVGFAAFVAYGGAATGRSALGAQDAWGGRNFHWPWDVAAASWQWALDHHDALQLVNLVALAGALVLVIAAARRVPLSYTLLALPQLLLLATRLQPTPLTSTTRYVLVVFPVFVVLALLGRRRRFDRAWTVASSVGLAVLAASFVEGNFVA